MTIIVGGLLNQLLVTGGLGPGGATVIRFHVYVEARGTILVESQAGVGPRDTTLTADAFLPRSTMMASEFESLSIDPRHTTLASEFEPNETVVEPRETTLAADPFLPRNTVMASNLRFLSIDPRATTLASELELPETTFEPRKTTLAADPFLPRNTTIADIA